MNASLSLLANFDQFDFVSTPTEVIWHHSLVMSLPALPLFLLSRLFCLCYGKFACAICLLYCKDNMLASFPALTSFLIEQLNNTQTQHRCMFCPNSFTFSQLRSFLEVHLRRFRQHVRGRWLLLAQAGLILVSLICQSSMLGNCNDNFIIVVFVM